jgi:hypothetical protein
MFFKLKTQMIKFFKSISRSPKKLAGFNAFLIIVIIACNYCFQVFCIPSTWSVIVLCICFLNTTIYPLIKHYSLSMISAFIHGISVGVYFYMICFLEIYSIIGLCATLIGIGFFVLTPHFFVLQLVYKTFIKPKFIISRLYFLAGIITWVFALIFISIKYNQALDSIEKFKQSNYAQLEKSFMVEKILGMHFLYHTRIEIIYDGWRPPKHEPILILGMWLNGKKDPLNLELKTRLRLYKIFFPKLPYKFNCSCALAYSKSYHNSDLWKND